MNRKVGSVPIVSGLGYIEAYAHEHKITNETSNDKSAQRHESLVYLKRYRLDQ